MATTRFAKYQGTGNDFVMIADPSDELVLTPGLVRRVCDRRFGVGADGVIRVASGRDGAELTMDYVNSDGSVVRCVATGSAASLCSRAPRGLLHRRA